LQQTYKTTDSFQNHVTAQTFEVAAQCMKAGGKQIMPQQSIQEHISPISQPQEQIAPPKTQNPPEDWLKPKIYKSSNLV